MGLRVSRVGACSPRGWTFLGPFSKAIQKEGEVECGEILFHQ